MFNEIMDVTNGLSVFNDYQSAWDEDRSSQCNEHWTNFTHMSNPNVHHKSQLPDSQCKGGKVFDQMSNQSTHHVYPIVEKTIQQSKNIKCLKQSPNSIKEMMITVGENVYKYLPCRKFFNQISNLNALDKTCPQKEHTWKDCCKTGHFGLPQPFLITTEFTLDRSLTNVENVLKLLPSPHISEIIRKFIQEGNFSNVVKVAVPLQSPIILPSITIFLLVKSFICTENVGKPLGGAHNLHDIR